MAEGIWLEDYGNNFTGTPSNSSGLPALSVRNVRKGTGDILRPYGGTGSKAFAKSLSFRHVLAGKDGRGGGHTLSPGI